MPSKVLCAVFAAALAAVVSAQNKSPEAPRELGSWGGSVGAEPPSPVGFRLDWDEQARLSATDALAAAWTAQHPAWRVVIDPVARTPWRAYGPGIPVAAPGAGETEIRAAAAGVAELLHALGASPGDAPTVRYVARAGRLWYASFDQSFGGVRADDAGLTVRIDVDGRLVMWGGRFLRAPDGGVAFALTEADAKFAALAALRGDSRVGASTRLTWGEIERVVHRPLADDAAPAAPAWKVRLSADAPLAEWVAYVDARTGAVREVWNDVRFYRRDLPPHLRPRRGTPGAPPAAPPAPASFTGTVTGTVHENVNPDQPPVSVAFPDASFSAQDVGGASGAVLSDAAGTFVWSGSPGLATTLTSGLEGPYITTNNAASGGPQASFNANVPAGATTFAAVWDDANSLLAERDAFFFGTRARNNVLVHNPAESLFNAALPANVNVNGSCNAFYNGTSINFYPAAGGCINTAYSDTVVEHEYGHHVTRVIWAAHGRTIPGHLGEGYSDAQAASCEDTNVIGAGFSGPGTLIRNLVNSCQWPASCGTGVHARGRVIGGSYWETRLEFANAFGAAGEAQMDGYLYQHFHGAPMTETDACLEMLLLDDDDANVLNGTPNTAKFLQGFTVDHGVPFPIPTLQVAHLPLGDTAEGLYPYEVRAAVSTFLGGAPASGSVLYSVDGGGFVAAPMTNLGAEWAGFIPNQAGPANVAYFFAFSDVNGVVSTYPVGAPRTPFAFRTYRPETFFVDGFEAPSGWTTSGVGQNDWQRQAPGNPAHGYDPPAAFEGTQCFGNDLSPAGFNGNYGNNVDNALTSPTIDCTGRTAVTLDYRRWLSVEDGLYDQATIEVSTNGGPFAAVWQNVAGLGGVEHHLDREWVRHRVRLNAADNQSNVVIRFRLVTDGGLVFGGWNVDDLRLDAAPSASILAATGSTAPGGTLTLTVSGVPGEAFALGADLFAPGAYVPFVGTMAVNPLGPSFLLLIPPGAVALPPGGAYPLALPVPPGLTGLTIWFEAVVIPLDLSPLVVSNAVPTLFV
jgi:hypothetical protein